MILTKEYWNDTLKYRYFYNSEGALVKKLDENTGKAVNYEYDSLGRLIHSQQSENGTVIQRTEHIYDMENRIQSQSWQMENTIIILIAKYSLMHMGEWQEVPYKNC